MAEGAALLAFPVEPMQKQCYATLPCTQSTAKRPTDTTKRQCLAHHQASHDAIDDAIDTAHFCSTIPNDNRC